MALSSVALAALSAAGWSLLTRSLNCWSPRAVVWAAVGTSLLFLATVILPVMAPRWMRQIMAYVPGLMSFESFIENEASSSKRAPLLKKAWRPLNSGCARFGQAGALPVSDRGGMPLSRKHGWPADWLASGGPFLGSVWLKTSGRFLTSGAFS